MSDEAADILRAQLPKETRKLTVADAAAATGLSLADAGSGLHVLVSEYRGHLRVGEEGDLVFLFPTGFHKPWETRDAFTRAWDRTAGFAVGAARFIVRAWVAVVLVGYVAIFVALLIALTLGGNRDSRSSDRGGGLFVGLFRLVAEALFWTLHPFSPFRVGAGADWTSRGARRRVENKTPFYERVDRFFFGPKKEPPPNVDAHRRAVLGEIRALKGRIGIGDVMRVTGLSRDEVDPLMSRLLVDYEGEIDVSEEGGIAYRFPDVRKTVQLDLKRPKPVWSTPAAVRPLTGNSFGEDFAIGALNAFNLAMSAWVVANGLTVERIFAIVTSVPKRYWPAPGTPIALGLVPLIFSIALFLLPLGRALFRSWERKRVARENGRRAVLRAVLDKAGEGGVTAKDLAETYRIAAGVEPTDQELTREVRALGGDVDIERAGEADGVHYRFVDLELEAKALEAEREAASDSEAKIGKVVFSSEV